MIHRATCRAGWLLGDAVRVRECHLPAAMEEPPAGQQWRRGLSPLLPSALKSTVLRRKALGDAA
ncbi:hypothetical protein [Sorangium sp. So ce887]|uniref:hypothetical protein n=1 Tax=Sorangium sp. So ce887 TaxID=3133324 RepID=UPI003F60D798